MNNTKTHSVQHRLYQSVYKVKYIVDYCSNEYCFYKQTRNSVLIDLDIVIVNLSKCILIKEKKK